jgi:single-strand DNA-binding protein
MTNVSSKKILDMSFEIEGKLHKVFPTESKTETFQAREFVIEIASGNYPQFIKFQLVQDRCSIMDNYNEGDMIKVYFDLRGREWNEKYFTNLNAWRVDKHEAESVAPPVTQSQDTEFPSASDEPAMGADDDLPF